MELFPVCTACAASATDFNPEPQTLLIVMAPVAGDSPPIDCGLSRRILPEPRRDDVAHDALVDLRSIDARALHSFAHNDGAKLRRGEIGEAALKFSHRRAAAGNDDNIVKRGHESSSREDFAVFIIDAASAGMRSRPEERATLAS